uniref:Uncharacterized protein n=1 Tax=Anguilla anguilla TaxID=7936 RepID=A0A0E9UXW7_ANGAN
MLNVMLICCLHLCNPEHRSAFLILSLSSHKVYF